jgi:hypothetical protein
VLPQDYEEIISRYHRNTAQDREWLEKRFLLDLWDDQEAADRERERVASTQERLADEIAKLDNELTAPDSSARNCL